MFYDKMISSSLGGADFYKNSYYKFEKYSELKRQYKNKYPNKFLFDFGIGEGDEMPPIEVLDELKKQIDVYENRVYADNGIEDLKKAALIHLKNIYGINFLNTANINHIMGAKSALSILPLAFVSPGEYVITTTPGYDVLGNFTKWINGNVYYAPLKSQNNFLVDLDNIPDNILRKTKIFIINYPNSPTGAIANKDFYKKLINLALKYNFLIVNDAVYGTLASKPLSILSLPNALSCCIEIHSFSKAFNMTGMRIGFIVSNEKIIKIFKQVKDNLDSGQYIPIQYAAIKAIEIQDKYLPYLYQKYQNRKKLICDVLNKNNYNIDMTDATFYLYMKVPNEYSSAKEFCEFLLKEYQIFVLPWDEVEPYVRLSMTFINPYSDDIEYAQKLNQRLSKKDD